MKIISDGTVQGTTVYTDAGEVMKNITALYWVADGTKDEAPSVLIKFTNVEMGLTVKNESAILINTDTDETIPNEVLGEGDTVKTEDGVESETPKQD